MGRNLKIDKATFKKAYRKARNMRQLSSILNITIMTAYTYVRRWEMKPYCTTPNMSDSLKVAKQYAYTITILDLAKKLNSSLSAVRYHLRKFIYYPVKYKLSIYPPPEKITHIKVINILVARPELLDHPQRIPALTNLSLYQVESYWKKAFKHSIEEYAHD